MSTATGQQVGPGRAGRRLRLELAAAARATAYRMLVLGAGSVALALVKIPHRPPTLCLLRAVTGVPCPFCGGTTAGVRLGHGDLAGAFLANPMVLIGALVMVAAPLLRPAEWWEARSGRTRILITVLVLAASEVWQLVRFGLLPTP
jgi:hypothetical protein